MAKFRPSLLDTLLTGTRAATDMPDGDVEETSVFPGLRLYSLDRMTEAAYLDTLRRDLSWLLNTIRLEDTVDLDQSPEVASSVLNFGIPDFSVRTVASVNVLDATAAIAKAIKAFEPRVNGRTLKVVGRKEVRSDDLPALMFDITCDVGPGADALHADFRTQIDVETGDAKLEPQR